jgi:hypothetical protein
MSRLARRNGWRGFDGIGERVDCGWRYDCDGMPSPFGCGETVTVPRRWTKVGTKRASGWLVCYGLEPKTPQTRFDDRSGWVEDHDIVLTYGPACAEVVRKQMTTPTTTADPERAAQDAPDADLTGEGVTSG